MTRVLRYPFLSAVSCLSALACAIARDICVGEGLTGWARVLLVMTFVLLALCFMLLSCRFFVDESGVGVGFLLRIRRTPWDALASVGVLSCNSRRTYLYGLYHDSPGFLELLHCAPACGYWGFVVPTSKKLVRAVAAYCPQEIDFTPAPKAHPVNPLRPLWHQAAVYLLMLIPGAALASFTGSMMLLRASGTSGTLPVVGLTLAACAMFAAGFFLINRAAVYITACPCINEEGVRAGFGMYMAWEDVRFGYVHRRAQVSGMFLLSQPLETVGKRGQKAVCCLSLPDTSTLLLAYLTYCPYAEKGISV